MAVTDDISQDRNMRVMARWRSTARVLVEALPYILRYDSKTIVVKYGGNAMVEGVTQDFAQDIVLMKQTGIEPVVVHGGGPQIGEMLKRLSIPSTFVDGLRVTDAAAIGIVEMVLTGSINKQIVSGINAAGGRAVGISGKDGNLILARKLERTKIDPASLETKPVDLGFVGEPETINPEVLRRIMQSDLIPVIAPIGVGRQGETYNINADTVSGAVAGAMQAERLILLTDVEGVLDQDRKLIPTLTAAEARTLIQNGTIRGGMIPKIETAIDAVKAGVKAAVILDGRIPHVLLLELFTEHGAGTLITAESISVSLRIALVAGALVCALASQAEAGLRLCNRTSYVLYAATGYVRGVDAITQGWTRIVSGTCETAIPEPLTARGYFVYARTSLAHAGTSRAWGGRQLLCAKDAGFSLRVPIASLRCPAEDTFALPFADVATRREKSWTMTFDETPPFLSMADAARAGTKRLLRDIGTKVASTDARPDKAVDVALTVFRKNHKFSSNGTALFDALESEALRTTAPSGYAVCNDTAAPIWSAIAFQNGGKWFSRGWWKIAAKGCAKLISEPLAADKIYLLAEKPSGAAIATGPAKFCIANVEFEIQGRTECPRHGQIEAGFAETRTKGRSGYTAHVGDKGLIAPRVIYVGTPK